MIGSFKRNQLEWAIWHVIDRGKMTTPEPPKQIVHLLKRLIDVDRQMGVKAHAPEIWQQHFAFIEGKSAGPGGENAYGLVDAVALWIGAQLLEAGLPQKDIIQFLRTLRGQLQRAVLKVLGSHLDLIERTAREKRGLAATKLRVGQWVAANDYVYLVAESIAASGVLGPERVSRKSNLCWGHEALVAFIEDAASRSRRFVVVELANAVVSLAYFLMISEPSKRGRTGPRS
jgi:hypothetical protein